MRSHANNNEMHAMGSRVAKLLRALDDDASAPVDVAIPVQDLKLLARDNPFVRMAMQETRRYLRGYWLSEEGHEKARQIIAKEMEDNGKLPNMVRLKKLGLGPFTRTNWGDSSRINVYLIFLHKSGYTPEEIVCAGLMGVSDTESLRKLFESIPS